MGLTGLEPVTSRLSGVCSNQLSYKPTVRNKSLTVLTAISLPRSVRHCHYLCIEPRPILMNENFKEH